ncbi:hypothetical protein FOA52_000212 [Chlamydomonas sp. UWO 241]|nr:hypothetical protein FOA52_000212 [Chlamydomonas sp. UWO 241]
MSDGGGSKRESVLREPTDLPRHLEAAIREVRKTAGAPANSKLHSIVMSYLKHQYRQACMHAAAPTSTLPPIPLSKPYALPAASRALDAPMNAAARLSRRDLDGMHGGAGGARAQRQYVYSRFRQVQVVRDDSCVVTSVAFLGNADMIAAGGHTGEIRIIDANAGEVVDAFDAHASGVVSLRVHSDDASDESMLLLSSSRSEAKLWDGFNPSRGPVVTWESATRARFNHAGTQVAAVSSGSGPRSAYIYDVGSTRKLRTLGAAPVGGGSPGAERAARSALSTAWSPDNELLLWGCALWDLRAPRQVHTFDQFTEHTSGCFHPRGLEVILNSEVWDLRSFKLLRSVPTLDGTNVTFSGGGDVMYCVARRPGDGEFSLGLL